MTSNLEIERKFLVEEEPEWLGDCESKLVEQGYLALEDEVEVRLRRADDETLLTVKRGSGGSREEVEVPIAEGVFESLWPLTEGRRVRKRRYVRAVDEGRFEIDVYEGELEGTITAEMEFESEAASADFQPPDWLGAELTGEEDWANRSLAVEGRPRQGMG